MIKFALDGTKLEDLTRGSEKKVLLICDKCAKESIINYGGYYNTQKRNNFSGKTYCQKCAFELSRPKRIGRIPWNKGLRRTDICNENSSNWRGWPIHNQRWV